jgi:hypothetical protein
MYENGKMRLVTILIMGEVGIRGIMREVNSVKYIVSTFVNVTICP